MEALKAIYWWLHRQRLLFKYDPNLDMMALVQMPDGTRQEHVLVCGPNHKEDNWLLPDGKTVTSRQIVDIEDARLLAGYGIGRSRPREHPGQEPLFNPSGTTPPSSSTF